MADLKLPKFLLACEGGEVPFEYVVHCHWPRFVMKVDLQTGIGTPQFLEPEAEIVKIANESGVEPGMLLARLMREAGDFFRSNS